MLSCLEFWCVLVCVSISLALFYINHIAFFFFFNKTIHLYFEYKSPLKLLVTSLCFA